MLVLFILVWIAYLLAWFFNRLESLLLFLSSEHKRLFRRAISYILAMSLELTIDASEIGSSLIINIALVLYFQRLSRASVDSFPSFSGTFPDRVR